MGFLAWELVTRPYGVMRSEPHLTSPWPCSPTLGAGRAAAGAWDKGPEVRVQGDATEKGGGGGMQASAMHCLPCHPASLKGASYVSAWMEKGEWANAVHAPLKLVPVTSWFFKNLLCFINIRKCGSWLCSIVYEFRDAFVNLTEGLLNESFL